MLIEACCGSADDVIQAARGGAAGIGHTAIREGGILHMPQGIAQQKVAVLNGQAGTFLQGGLAVGRSFKAAGNHLRILQAV